jgi:hypothetical protein
VRRVWFRAGALALGAVALLVGITVYFSAETVPPCFASGTPTWHPPTDGGTHRYEIVFPDRAACFFAIDDGHKLVGQLRLNEARGISVAAQLQQDVALRTEAGVFTLDLRTGKLRRGGLAPFPSSTLTLQDDEHRVMYVTQRGLLGFRVLAVPSAAKLYDVRFKGFTWNPRFGPNPPSHGLSLAPDRPELWVLDSPNSTVHVFDVSALPGSAPRAVEDIRLSETLTRIGSLQHSANGRYVYVGDAGDVIDTSTSRPVANLEALRKSRVMLEVDFAHGRPSFPEPG